MKYTKPSKQHIQKQCESADKNHLLNIDTAFKIYNETPIFPIIRTEERIGKTKYSTLVRQLNKNGKYYLTFCATEHWGQESTDSLKRALMQFYKVQYLSIPNITILSNYGFPLSIEDECQITEEKRLIINEIG